MANEFKQCPNGHYYQGSSCPYCKTGNTFHDENVYEKKTEVFNKETETIDPAETVVGMGGNMPSNSTGGVKTTVIDNGSIVRKPGVSYGSGGGNPNPMSGRTVFGDEDETEVVVTSAGERMQRVSRESRKLVGWLVSYTIDPLGVDFKIYEGRNTIGRDQDCNITVSDNRVSSKHAVLLFRSGKFSITDQQSSHGTFVNNSDIELEPCYLSDGDIIQVGQTVFKFRSSL